MWKAAKADIALLQVRDRVDQVAQRATEPVELPDDQSVARSHLVENLRQLGSLVEGAARCVGEDPIATGRLECVELQVRMLVGCRNACVAEQVRHGPAAYQKRRYDQVMRR